MGTASESYKMSIICSRIFIFPHSGKFVMIRPKSINTLIKYKMRISKRENIHQFLKEVSIFLIFGIQLFVYCCPKHWKYQYNRGYFLNQHFCFFTPIFVLHQNFCFFDQFFSARNFLFFYRIFFTPKYLLVLHQNVYFFTPIFLLHFYTNFFIPFLHQFFYIKFWILENSLLEKLVYKNKKLV